MLRRSVFDTVIPAQTAFGEYFIEFAFQSLRRGLSVVEIPYIHIERGIGDSKAEISPLKFCRLGASYALRIMVSRIRCRAQN